MGFPSENGHAPVWTAGREILLDRRNFPSCGVFRGEIAREKIPAKNFGAGKYGEMRRMQW
jgi:hypothetical protein